MAFLKTIVLWIVEWAAKKLAVLIAAWIKRRQERQESERKQKEVREAQEKANTPEERENAAEKTIDNF